MRFPGIIPAVTTPFDERGEIRDEALQTQCHVAWSRPVSTGSLHRNDGGEREPDGAEREL